MILHVYSIVDKISKRCSTSIFTAVNDEIAMKRYENTMKEWKDKGILTDDMTLIHLGMYETETIENKDSKGAVVSLEKQLYSNVKYTYIVNQSNEINQDELGKAIGEKKEKEVYKELFGEIL